VLALQWRGSRSVERVGRGRLNGWATVDGTSEPVQYTPEQKRRNSQKRLILAGDYAVAELKSVDFLEWQRQHLTVPESDHLRPDRTAGRCAYFAEIADRSYRAARGDQQADHFRYFAYPGQDVGIWDVSG
jgi:hypothetical protein